MLQGAEPTSDLQLNRRLASFRHTDAAILLRITIAPVEALRNDEAMTEQQSGLFLQAARSTRMSKTIPKPRRSETPAERCVRIADGQRRAMDQALREQDALDAKVRLSIEQHGA